MALPALFEGTSQEVGRFFHVYVKSDESLGAKLINCDVSDPAFQFYPGYALVGGFMDDNDLLFESSCYKQIIKRGDIFIAVTGHGFRRFAYRPDSEVPLDTNDTIKTTSNIDTTGMKVELDHVVIPTSDNSGAYRQFMEKLKAVKLANGDPPLILTLIRFDWDARCFAWRRFLAARENVPAALQLYQQHVDWRSRTFPMDISSPGIQAIFANRSIAQIDSGNVRAVYVDYGSLLQQLSQLEGSAVTPTTTTDIRNAFLLVTEKLLAAEQQDPRYPSITHLIDVSGVSSSVYTASSFRTDILRDIYATFEPNYPETLHKMILYPISPMMATTIRTLLSFVNETTRKKFIVTGDANLVCVTLQWDLAKVEAAGGVQAYVHTHETSALA